MIKLNRLFFANFSFFLFAFTLGMNPISYFLQLFNNFRFITKQKALKLFTIFFLNMKIVAQFKFFVLLLKDQFFSLSSFVETAR